MVNKEDEAATMEALKRLWHDPRQISLVLHGSDAWITCSIIQFACRNPALRPAQRQIAERVGRELQAAVVNLAPDLADILELGWNPDYDVPREEGRDG